MAVKSEKGKASIKAAATRLANKKSGATNTQPTTRTITYKSGNSVTQTLTDGKYVTTSRNKATVPTPVPTTGTKGTAGTSLPKPTSSRLTATTTTPRITPTVDLSSLSGGAMGPTAQTTPLMAKPPVPLQAGTTTPSAVAAPTVTTPAPAPAPAGATTTGGATPTPEQLAEYMRQAQEMQAKVQALKEKQKTPVEDAIVSDEEIVNEEDAALKSLEYEAPTTAALTLLNAEIDRLKDNLRADTQAINQIYNAQRTSTEDTQSREAGQLSVGLANAGGYLGFSGSGTGVMLTLANSHRDELLALEAERSKAVMEARIASENRRYDLVKLKADEIARIDNEAYAREQDYLTRKQELATAEMGRAEKLKMQGDIMEQITAGFTKPQDIFTKLNGAYTVEEINGALEALAPASKSSDLFKYSSSDVGALLGAGLNQEDIAALSDTVNELGYTDEVRQALPASVRAVADSIYRAKTGGGGASTSSGITVNGKKISSVALQVLDGFTKLSNLTPTMQQQVRDDLYDLGFADETPPDWFDPASLPAQYQISYGSNFNPNIFPGIDVTQEPGLQTMMPGFDRQASWEAYVRGVLSDGEDSDIASIDASRALISERTRE